MGKEYMVTVRLDEAKRGYLDALKDVFKFEKDGDMLRYLIRFAGNRKQIEADVIAHISLIIEEKIEERIAGLTRDASFIRALHAEHERIHANEKKKKK